MLLPEESRHACPTHQPGSCRHPANQQPLKSQAKWKRVIIALLALLYIISLLDLIPDVIPVIGLMTGRARVAARQVLFKRDVWGRD